MKYNFDTKFFRSIDKALARYIIEIGEEKKSILPFSAALVSRALANGDTCIDLNNITPKEIWFDIDDENNLPIFPSPKNWIEDLANSNLVSFGDKDTPLTLINSRLYLTRQYRYEKNIADLFDSATTSGAIPKFSKETTSLIKKLFSNSNNFKEIDLQLAGALLPFFYRYSILTGGPGTGKTTTIVKMLAIALSENPDISIALAAPTGKAVQRMNESILNGVKYLSLQNSISDSINNLQAKTIHRLLGTKHNRSSFWHNKSNPLHCDLLIVDESSMIDIAMMSKLLLALKPTAKLILLGDQYQLASVEAGTVLGDLCSRYGANQFSTDFLKLYSTIISQDINIDTSNKNRLSPVIKLLKSHRFDALSMIGKVSQKINSDENSKEAIEELNERGEVQIHETFTIENIAKRYEPLIKSKSTKEALENLENSIILTAKNHGSWGQHTINENLIGYFYTNKSSKLFTNMPIMVTQNSYAHDLFNGDIGVLKEVQSEWVACFKTTNEIKEIPLVLIPTWQPAFAITIHKSQGSEYKEVMILLERNDSILFTKELLYTAITRAKPEKGSSEGAVIIVAPKEVAINCVKRRIMRSSGLGAIMPQME